MIPYGNWLKWLALTVAGAEATLGLQSNLSNMVFVLTSPKLRQIGGPEISSIKVAACQEL
jgi:hypothetical protein